MEELTKKELLDYLEEISQQLNNIALDQIPFAISELYFKLENSIPISFIKNKIEELNKDERKQSKGMKGQDRYVVKQEFMYKRNILQELLDERNNTDGN